MENIGRLGSLDSVLEAAACQAQKGQHKNRERSALVENEHRCIQKHRQKNYVKSSCAIPLITYLHTWYATKAYGLLPKP